ncbi:MAG: DUF5053 domain-containing protein [Candidatus Amulumruptor caecigallinarius]|nr:DUF5053 domain-containing protein [Candidatus Amulumruptor caecigallinarius]
MGKKKITYEQFNDPAFRRAEQMKVKSEAVWVTFAELAGLINVSKLAKEYFHKSQSWFAQKVSGMSVCNKERSFTSEEYARLSNALRDIANRLNEYADAIDAAEE